MPSAWTKLHSRARECAGTMALEAAWLGSTAKSFPAAKALHSVPARDSQQTSTDNEVHNAAVTISSRSSCLLIARTDVRCHPQRFVFATATPLRSGPEKDSGCAESLKKDNVSAMHQRDARFDEFAQQDQACFLVHTVLVGVTYSRSL